MRAPWGLGKHERAVELVTGTPKKNVPLLPVFS